MTTQDGGARPAANRPGTGSTVPRTEAERLIWTEAYLAGYDRGYEARVDEENATYPPPKALTFGRWYDQAAERQKADAETRRLVDESRAAQRRAASRALDRHISNAYGTASARRSAA